MIIVTQKRSCNLILIILNLVKILKKNLVCHKNLYIFLLHEWCRSRYTYLQIYERLFLYSRNETGTFFLHFIFNIIYPNIYTCFTSFNWLLYIPSTNNCLICHCLMSDSSLLKWLPRTYFFKFGNRKYSLVNLDIIVDEKFPWNFMTSYLLSLFWPSGTSAMSWIKSTRFVKSPLLLDLIFFSIDVRHVCLCYKK